MAVVRSRYPSIPLNEDADLVEFVLSKCDKHGDKIALQDSNGVQALQFDELRPLVRRIASGLIRAGLQKGDVVLLCMNGRVEVLPILLGVVAAGGVFTSCNPQLKPDEIHDLWLNSMPAFMLVQNIFLEKLLKATETVKDNIKNAYVVGEVFDESSRRIEPFSTLTDDSGDLYPPTREADSKEDTALMFYSSGTTGRQKGVMLTSFNIVSTILMTCHPEGLLMGEDAVAVVFTPMFHMSGLLPLLINPYYGNTVVTMERFDLELYLSLVQKHKVKEVVFVPPIVMLLANDPRVKGYDLTSVQTVVIGAAPLGKEGEDLLRKTIGNDDLQIRQIYGMTECLPITLMPPSIRNKQGSVGLVCPNVSVKIVDIDSGATLGPNEQGELCTMSPCSLKGYVNNAEADRDIFDADGWLHTGDIAYYDEDEYFYIVDRLKELIKYNAFQVPPAELESLLLGHPQIADVCVIGVPDKMAGELPKAFVVLKKDSDVTEEELVQYVQDRVVSYKRLRGGVEFVAAIPKLASGKILRRQLRDAERAKSKEKV